MQMMEYRAIAPLKIDKSLTARIFKEEKLSLIPIKKIKVIEGVEDDVTNELVQMSKYSKKKVNNFSLSTNSEKQFKQITSTLVFEQKIARDSTEEEQKEKHEQTINLKKNIKYNNKMLIFYINKSKNCIRILKSFENAKQNIFEIQQNIKLTLLNELRGDNE